MLHRQQSVLIQDRSAVGEARRVAVSAAEAMGFDEEQRSNIGVVVTEAARNIQLHAKHGELLICPLLTPAGEPSSLSVLALDAGPGILNVGMALEDGYSTHGTAGQGLGAIHRMSDRVALYTVPRRGTAVLAQFLLEGAPERTPRGKHASYGAVNIPVKGERENGDAFLVTRRKCGPLFAVVDGLGHGPAAEHAAQAAVGAVRQNVNEPLAEILAITHDALRSTRGAAMSLALVDEERSVLTFAGVGNVSGTLTNGAAGRSMVSQNGTLGAVMPRTLQEYTYPYTPGTMMLMFSDGIGSKCSFAGYPGLMVRHPQLVAGVLYRDFTRRRDDATLLAARLEGARA